MLHKFAIKIHSVKTGLILHRFAIEFGFFFAPFGFGIVGSGCLHLGVLHLRVLHLGALSWLLLLLARTITLSLLCGLICLIAHFRVISKYMKLI